MQTPGPTIDADRLLAETQAFDALVFEMTERVTDFLEACGAWHPREVIKGNVSEELRCALEDLGVLLIPDTPAFPNPPRRSPNAEGEDWSVS